jgi:hypothetical protein
VKNKQHVFIAMYVLLHMLDYYLVILAALMAVVAPHGNAHQVVHYLEVYAG